MVGSHFASFNELTLSRPGRLEFLHEFVQASGLSRREEVSNCHGDPHVNSVGPSLQLLGRYTAEAFWVEN